MKTLAEKIAVMRWAEKHPTAKIQVSGVALRKTLTAKSCYWNWADNDYSIASPPLVEQVGAELAKGKPVPPGDLTCGQAQDLLLLGATIEWCKPRHEIWHSVWSAEWIRHHPELAYRLKPKPEYVPLDASDWDSSPVWWVRVEKDKHDHQLVTALTAHGIVAALSGGRLFDELMTGQWERSADRKTWTPCRKVKQ